MIVLQSVIQFWIRHFLQAVVKCRMLKHPDPYTSTMSIIQAPFTEQSVEYFTSRKVLVDVLPVSNYHRNHRRMNCICVFAFLVLKLFFYLFTNWESRNTTVYMRSSWFSHAYKFWAIQKIRLRKWSPSWTICIIGMRLKCLSRLLYYIHLFLPIINYHCEPKTKLAVRPFMHFMFTLLQVLQITRHSFRLRRISSFYFWEDIQLLLPDYWRFE